MKHNPFHAIDFYKNGDAMDYKIPTVSCQVDGFKSIGNY